LRVIADTAVVQTTSEFSTFQSSPTFLEETAPCTRVPAQRFTANQSVVVPPRRTRFQSNRFSNTYIARLCPTNGSYTLKPRTTWNIAETCVLVESVTWTGVWEYAKHFHAIVDSRVRCHNVFSTDDKSKMFFRLDGQEHDGYENQQKFIHYFSAIF
jgi:hypothetical protein